MVTTGGGVNIKYHNGDDLHPENRGRWRGLRFRTHVDACRCGDGVGVQFTLQ